MCLIIKQKKSGLIKPGLFYKSFVIQFSASKAFLVRYK